MSNESDVDESAVPGDADGVDIAVTDADEPVEEGSSDDVPPGGKEDRSPPAANPRVAMSGTV